MAIWAIGDLHLSFGVKGKEMDVFGENWTKHHEKIQRFWDAQVQDDDLVLLVGDTSWAMTLDQAEADFAWVHERPGTKLLIKGNHDYWWSSASKIRKALPESMHILSQDAFLWEDVAIAGARLWDSSEYTFSAYIDMQPEKKKVSKEYDDEKIFQREVGRLQKSMDAMNDEAKFRIVMTHYPPISADLKASTISTLFDEKEIDVCVFGHLHSLKKGSQLFGKRNKTDYILTSCDWLDFVLVRIYG